MFSCSAQDFWRLFELPVPVRNRLVVNDRPQVRQLETILAEHPTDVMVALLLVLGGRDPPRGARRAPASLVPAIKTERPRPGQASAPRLVRPWRDVSPYRPS